MTIQEVDKFIDWFLTKHKCNRQDRDDVKQECFVKFLQQKKRFDDSKSSMSTFLYIICFSAYTDFLRKQKHIKEHECNLTHDVIAHTNKVENYSLFEENDD